MALAGEFLPGLGRSDDAPPPAPAPDKRGRGRPRKDGTPVGSPRVEQPAQKPAPAPSAKEEKPKGLPWFREGETLSEREATALYDPLIAALSDYMDYMDEYIWYRTQDAAKEPVWSNYDEDEVGAIARLLIKRGKRSAAAATVVRGIVNGDDYITATVFVVPRIVESQRRLRAAPKRERRPRR